VGAPGQRTAWSNVTRLKSLDNPPTLEDGGPSRDYNYPAKNILHACLRLPLLVVQTVDEDRLLQWHLWFLPRPPSQSLNVLNWLSLLQRNDFVLFSFSSSLWKLQMLLLL
jgi:hypothetical protein